MSRFIIAKQDFGPDLVYKVLHDFVSGPDSAGEAFRTLYNRHPDYVLFQQVAVSEPAGSCDEADDTSGEDSIQSNAEYDPITGERYY